MIGNGGLFSLLDILALAWFAAAVAVFWAYNRIRGTSDQSITDAMDRRRLQWMESMAAREMRMVDTQILANLTQGQAFFASTSVIVIGGLAALIGAAKEAQELLSEIPFVPDTSPTLLKLKIMFLMGIFIFAFFKFAWAFRLSHLAAIMIGATPPAGTAEPVVMADFVRRATALTELMGHHSNIGLKAYYFAMAALGWFLHPVLFMVFTTLVAFVVYRREYRSRARQAVLDDPMR